MNHNRAPADLLVTGSVATMMHADSHPTGCFGLDGLQPHLTRR